MQHFVDAFRKFIVSNEKSSEICSLILGMCDWVSDWAGKMIGLLALTLSALQCAPKIQKQLSFYWLLLTRAHL